MRKIRITGMHKEDALYYKKEDFIGLKGLFEPNKVQFHLPYISGKFYHEKFIRPIYFLAVRYVKL